jgi:hypothetical protein
MEKTDSAAPVQNLVRTPFVEELDVFVNVETCGFPVFKGSRVHIQKADYNCVTLEVDMSGGDETRGVWFGIDDEDGSLVVELYASKSDGSQVDEPISFRLVDGKWVSF